MSDKPSSIDDDNWERWVSLVSKDIPKPHLNADDGKVVILDTNDQPVPPGALRAHLDALETLARADQNRPRTIVTGIHAKKLFGRFIGPGLFRDELAIDRIFPQATLSKMHIRRGTLLRATNGDVAAIDRLCRRLSCLIEKQRGASKQNSQAASLGMIPKKTEIDALIATIAESLNAYGRGFSDAFLVLLFARLGVSGMRAVTNIDADRKDGYLFAEKIRRPDLSESDMADAKGVDKSTINRRLKNAKKQMNAARALKSKIASTVFIEK